jgi:uncharacterized repeat protein (TIGR01451 family)
LIRTLSPLHRTLTFGIGYAVAVVVALCLTLMANSVAHAQTRAGTPIVNTAGLQYEAGGETHALDSNTVTLLVAERLDVRLVRDGQGAVAIDDGPTAVAFILTNADNGDEAFAVTADLAAGAAPTLAIDSDKNARYDPVHDAALVAGTTPALAPGETLRLFAIVAPGTASESLVVTARTTTGSGAVGSAFDGKGDGGSDAVVGPTGAAASVTVPLRSAGADPVLIKTQSVANTDGARRGGIITYTLAARFTGSVRAAVIEDLIPNGTSFVAGSLRLDNAVLTDGVDTDAGSFDGRGIAVALGDVIAASTHIVQFKAQIQ